jgi:LacI family transcriptional regulator
MAIRIVDIAKVAKVSPATVSLALNNKPGVSDEVRATIVALARELGYKIPGEDRPSRPEGSTIRLLKIVKHGHIVNERHNAFIADYLEGLETQAKSSGYTLEVGFFNKVPVGEIIAANRDLPVKGFVVLGTELDESDMTALEELALPLVFIDTFSPFSLHDCVDMNNTDEVFRIVRYFRDCGHRDIGLVKSTFETRNFKMRETGFYEALDYFSLPLDRGAVFSVDSEFEQSQVDMTRILGEGRKLPDALFCVNDIIAYGCMKAAREAGYGIPDDVSIVGFDDLPSSAMSDPPLTTIRVSKHQIGRRAMGLLIGRIEGNIEDKPEKVLVGGELVVRQSVRNLGGR